MEKDKRKQDIGEIDINGCKVVIRIALSEDSHIINDIKQMLLSGLKYNLHI